jgi:hypothetical protein
MWIAQAIVIEALASLSLAVATKGRNISAQQARQQAVLGEKAEEESHVTIPPNTHSH